MLYRWTRSGHLYAGLFVSPIVILFAVSVPFLNHAKVDPDAWTIVERMEGLEIPDGLENARGADAVVLARQVLVQLGMTGEVGSPSYQPQRAHFVFPVSRPGLEARVDVDARSGVVTVSRRTTSWWETFAYLHKMPGPHNVAIRGNWSGTRAWRWLADASVYLLLFLSLSGIYLWTTIKAERRVGLALATAGGLTFFGLIYVVIR